MSSNGLLSKPPLVFYETEPVDIWSGIMPLNRLSYKTFVGTVIQAAESTGQRFTGFMTRDETFVDTFTRTRYPRKKYGVVPVSECRMGMLSLARMLDTHVIEENRDDLRVVMGLVEGYEPDAPTHTVDEIRDALPGAAVAPAEVFALRPGSEGPSIYTEPAAVISAPPGMRTAIYQLGDAIGQERFTIEDFDRGLAYVVETRHCTEPDA